MNAFLLDYYSRKFSSEASGWRSFVDISHQTKVPLSAFYRRNEKDLQGLSELERKGLVEIRLYSGERGRGGEIIRARIAFDKEEIRKYVLTRVGKIPRNIAS